MSSENKWNDVIDLIKDTDDIGLGKYYSYNIEHDIKHLGFIFARYKFCAKMMERRKDLRVLELGSSYGLGAQFINQTKACSYYCGVDLDHDAVEYAQKTFGNTRTVFVEADFMNRLFTGADPMSLEKRNVQITPPQEKYDAVISLDVIEHIEPRLENDFVNTIKMNISDDGFAIIGTPNITMNPYASKGSKLAHINLYDYNRLYSLLSNSFRNVFMFGMNDEVLHTGFAPMSCYIFALCTV